MKVFPDVLEIIFGKVGCMMFFAMRREFSRTVVASPQCGHTLTSYCRKLPWQHLCQGLDPPQGPLRQSMGGRAQIF